MQLPQDALGQLINAGVSAVRVEPGTSWRAVQTACIELLGAAPLCFDGTDQCFGVNHVWLGHGDRRSDSAAALSLHQEGYDEPVRPRYVAFLCVESGRGGGTTHADTRAPFESLPRLHREALARAQIRFRRSRDPFEMWSAWFPVIETNSTKRELLRFAEPEVGYREVEIPAALEAFRELRQRLSAEVKVHSWNAGDVLLLDNHRVVHGREAIAEGCRRHLIRLAFA
ncbi:MAG: TauD/TfdA family dioxygenase [Pseudomonadota bacterium]